MVPVTDYSNSILSFPGALVQPLAPSELISSVYFVPVARRLSKIPGVLVNQIFFGSFRVAWDVRILMNPCNALQSFSCLRRNTNIFSTSSK